jgi:hypothetical protein
MDISHKLCRQLDVSNIKYKQNVNISLVSHIDILTPDNIILIRPFMNWKSALGEYIILFHFYKNRNYDLYLFGTKKHCSMGIVQDIFHRNNINIVYILT